MCDTVDAQFVMPGWGCCRCRTYNGLQRSNCRHCGEKACDPLKPDLHTKKVFAVETHEDAKGGAT